jgi:hypothetical protein
MNWPKIFVCEKIMDVLCEFMRKKKQEIPQKCRVQIKKIVLVCLFCCFL